MRLYFDTHLTLRFRSFQLRQTTTAPVRLHEGKAKSCSATGPVADRLGRSSHPSRVEVVATNTKNRDWHVLRGDIRKDISIAQEIVEFIEEHGALSVIMTNGIIGCPHQEGIDYQGKWCPVCEFWRGRDRFTGQMLH